MSHSKTPGMLLTNQPTFRFLILALFFLRGLETVSSAQSLKYSNSLFQNKDWNFVENKGQIAPSDIKYYGHQGGVYLYCKPGMISFVFTKVEKTDNTVSEATGSVSGIPLPKGAPVPTSSGGGFGRNKSIPSKITTSRADLVLINANPNSKILASDQQEYYENYYTTPNKSGQAGADSGITNVHTFKTITYKEIYPHIDIVLACREKGLEYSFVVYPGGKVSDIQMKWEGIEKIKTFPSARTGKNYKIEHSTALGKIDEGKPVSFQGDNAVVSSFERQNNKVGFKVGGYDKEKILVIDPTLDWATYYGGPGQDDPCKIVVDNLGNVFMCGGATSSSGIATSGAYQTSFIGTNFDSYLAKFNSNGGLIWATYYGGDDGNNGNPLAIDKNGNLFVAGQTRTTTGIVTSGAYQTSLDGTGTAYLAKFNTSGQLQWGTYYGGSSEAKGTSVATDKNGNVFIAGFAGRGIPIVNSGAYQTSNSGTYNVFLAKFSATGVIQWDTYYGGSGPDECWGATTDFAGNVYITGSTESHSGIATTGAYQTFFKGSDGAFIAKFNGNGEIQWATYYCGDSFTDGYYIISDLNGNIYESAVTLSSSGIATYGAYQTSYGGDYDAYLVKFNSNGIRQWATYFGGKGVDGSSDVTLDIAGNVYIAGHTRSSTGIATSGAYQTSKGQFDGFLAKFNSSGSIQWATYYAVSGLVATYGTGIVYLAGGSAGNGIATSGAYQVSSAGYSNSFLSKFNFFENDADIKFGINSRGKFCSGTKALKLILSNNGTKYLDSVRINLSINNKLEKPYKWTGSLAPDVSDSIIVDAVNFPAGVDTIKAWTSFPNGAKDSVSGNDTVLIIDTVYASPLALTAKDSSICPGNKITLGSKKISGHFYSWTSKPLGFTSNISNPVIIPKDSVTQYYLTETNTNGCTKTDSVTVTVIPSPKPNPGSSKILCSGDTVTIGTNGPINGFKYTWKSIQSGTYPSLPRITIKPDITAWYILKLTDSATGCTGIDSVLVYTYPLPKPKINGPKMFCADHSPNIFTVQYDSGSGYSWNLNNGYIIGGQSTDTVNLESDSGFNTIYLTEIDDHGCQNTDSLIIYAEPLLDAHWKLLSDSPIFVFKAIDTTGQYYNWTFGDGTIGSNYIEKHKYNFTKDSTVSVSLTVTTAFGCSSIFDSAINIRYIPNPQFYIEVFPNPFYQNTNIKISLDHAAHIQIILYDDIGRLIGELIDTEQPENIGLYSFDADRYNLAYGIYYFKILVDGKVYVRAVVRTE